MTDAGALREAYRDLTEIDRRREGIRYFATLADGTPVVALAITPEVSERVEATEAFVAAFQRAAAVHHEALIPPLAWGSVSDGTLHCAYARLDAEEATPGSFPPASVARIGVQLARALTTMHRAGLVHGAISTARVVMTRDRGALLGDFGLFAALSEGGLGIRATSELLSDPGYPSPEVQLGKIPDERSDIYSLGASLYELLTGKPPYGGRTTSYLLAAVLPDQTADAKDNLPSPVVEALVRAIERAPEDRWPSAAAFATTLAAGASVGEARATRAKARLGCLPAASLSVLLAAATIGVFVHG